MEELILKERETREKLVEVVNDSKLPAFILKTIIKDLYEQLNQIEQQQYGEALRSKQNKDKKKEAKQ